MKTTLLDKIVCPSCSGRLRTCHSGNTVERDIETGMLVCACGSGFPIVRGIPRMLVNSFQEFPHHVSHSGAAPAQRAELRDFENVWEKTQRSFGRQWLRYEVQNLEEDAHTFQMKTGSRLEELRGLHVLDAGCGGGRYTYMAAKAGADVVAVDISPAVEKARQLCREFPNVEVVQANLLQLPFRREMFDFIYAIGVLHHTPNTSEAFEALIPYLKPGGRIAVWVYPKWSPLRESMNRFWRSITTRLPHALVHAIAVLGAPLGGMRGRVYRSRWRVMARLLWQTEKLIPGLSNHPDRRQRICDTFDWLTPQYQWHHTEEEVRRWFEDAGLTDIRNVSSDADSYHPDQGTGINFVGRRPG